MKYYLLHGIDASRKTFMENQFAKFGIPPSDVTWITKPNKFDDLPEGICTNDTLTRGQIACTYKHYLALKDIVEKKHPIAVIMEDNIEFQDNVPKKLNRYLHDAVLNWGCIFDSDIGGLTFIESAVTRFKSVYKKTNQVTEQCRGGSKGANFIVITLDAATKMLSTFLPFDHVSDHYYNKLLREHSIISYWAEPPNVHKIERPSTCTTGYEPNYMDESRRTYVSSRGILKSCEYFDKKPNSSDTVVRFEIPDTPKALIYVSTSAVDDFIERILPTRTNSFVLISGDADTVVPDHIKNADTLLNNDLLIGWFSQNCIGNHPKLHRIPIGLDYHTLATYTDHVWGHHILPEHQESMLMLISRFSQPFWKRAVHCYGTFHFNWYVSEKRAEAKEKISPDVITYQAEKIKRDELWNEMAKYAFIPSPEGAGPDCHRTWEALVLGCIPIVKSSGLDPLFEGLPVWIVNDWTDITKESMKEKVEQFKTMTFNPRRLHLQTWVNKIIKVRNA
jgi:GR25 family glycosyltransferase involved in LPS biosynthesis